MSEITKETYADKIQDLIPDGVKLLKRIDFIKAEKMPGNFYNQPCILTNEHGFTYGGVAGNAFELLGAINSTSANAQVQGTELVLRSFLSIGAVSRSQNSKAAFVSETKLLVENMLKSFAKRMEIQLMYGRAGLGVVESVAGQVIKIEDHEWAPGIWSGGENMKITILNAALTVTHGDFTVSAVSLETKEITVVEATGAILATDVIFFLSAASAGPVFNEFAGIHKIITNTGVLFNINASAYNLWKGNVVEVGTNFTGGEAILSFAKIERGIEVAMNKGLSDEAVTVICNPGSWTNLLTEQAAKRSYDSSYSKEKFVQGAKAIEFYGANGMIEIVSSIYCKEGYAYMLPIAEFMRVGSSDISFEQAGMEGKYVRLLENHNGYEFRAYSDQSLYTSKPGLCTLLTYIKNV